MIKGEIQSAIFFLSALLAVSGCSVTKIQKHGYTNPDSFYYKCEFSTIKALIVLPVELDGANGNFLFDTGAEVTVIQRDTTRGKTVKIDGAAHKSMKLIGDVEFIDTYAMGGDFVGLKEQIPGFGGIIGQPIISKANWLIDYPNKTMEISSRHLGGDEFMNLNIRRDNGSPYVTLTIDGIDYQALIDLGSSSAFTIPEGSKLADRILSKYDFQDNERAVYTIGGLENTKEKVGNIASINLDGIEFDNVSATIRHTSQLRIGNEFFKDCIVYIDNENSTYSVKKLNR